MIKDTQYLFDYYNLPLRSAPRSFRSHHAACRIYPKNKYISYKFGLLREISDIGILGLFIELISMFAEEYIFAI